MGTAGCNMGCIFCQKVGHLQSKVRPGALRRSSPAACGGTGAWASLAAHRAHLQRADDLGEYVIDIAREAHEAGINTVMVSNGYITRMAFFDIYRYIDATNIDLKAFIERFYSQVTLMHLQRPSYGHADGIEIRGV